MCLMKLQCTFSPVKLAESFLNPYIRHLKVELFLNSILLTLDNIHLKEFFYSHGAQNVTTTLEFNIFFIDIVFVLFTNFSFCSPVFAFI